MRTNKEQSVFSLKINENFLRIQFKWEFAYYLVLTIAFRAFQLF